MLGRNAATAATVVLALSTTATAIQESARENAAGGPPPDIGFDTASWHFDSEVTVSKGGPNGTTICIHGNNKSYIQATTTVAVADLPHGQFYFIADVSLENIAVGTLEYFAPKLKVTGEEHHETEAANLRPGYTSAWMPAALQVTPSAFLSDTHLVFEISIQETTGTFCARAPRLDTKLPPPTYSYPFPNPANRSVVVEVKSAKAKAFNNHLLSTNSQLAGLAKVGVGYSGSQMQQLLDWLKLPILRFPGGTIGNFYDWTTDSCHSPSVDACTAHRKACTNTSFPFELDGYIKAMHATNASTVLMFNVDDDDVETSVARLINHSHRLYPTPIPWIELGNENYDQAQSCGNINPENTPPRTADYIAFTAKLAAGLRAASDKVAGGTPLLAAPLQASLDWGEGSWNKNLSTSSVYDGFIIHPYVSAASALFTPVIAGQILEASGVMRGYLMEYAQNVGASKPLLLTEFGIMGSSNGTFVQTIGEASMFMQIIDLFATDALNIVQAGVHILVTGTQNNAFSLFGWDDATNGLVASYTGAVWWKLVQTLRDSTLLGATTTGPTLPSGAPSVDVQALRTHDGNLTLLIVNKLGVPAEVATAVDGVKKRPCGMEVLTAAGLDWKAIALDEVPSVWASVSVGSGPVLDVPPMSIAVVHVCE